MSSPIDRGRDLWLEVKDKADDGFNCPCCNRYVKRYKRKIHTEMAKFLCKLYLANRGAPGHWFNTRDFDRFTAKASTDASYLVHWGLVETLKDKVGYYRITPSGCAFVEGRITVPQRVHILCGEVEGFSKEITDIHGALGNRFSLKELLGQ